MGEWNGINNRGNDPVFKCEVCDEFFYIEDMAVFDVCNNCVDRCEDE